MIRIISLTALVFILSLALVFFSNVWVNSSTNAYLYDNVYKIPKNDIGVVLGTSRLLTNGRKNYFFKYRMEATVKLYNANKISEVYVSGDKSDDTYDEPTAMKRELVKLGIPSSKIKCDFEGFSTYESITRMNRTFGHKKFTVISQKFQNQRAVFLARNNNLDVIGFNATDIRNKDGLEKTHVREIFARAKSVIDLFTFGILNL